MKIQEFNYLNDKIIQIYINRTEQEEPKTIEQISSLKKQYSNISIFINGENETMQTIKEILNYEKNKIAYE